MISTPQLHIGQQFCKPTSRGPEYWLIDKLHTDVVFAHRSDDGLKKRFFRETVERWISEAARSTGAFPQVRPSSSDRGDAAHPALPAD